MTDDWIHIGGSGPVAALLPAGDGRDPAALEAASAGGIMGLLGMLLPAGLDALPDFVIAETADDGTPRRVLLRGAPTAHLTGPDVPDLLLSSDGLLPWRDVTIPQGYATLTLSRPEPPPAWAASGWQMPTFFGAAAPGGAPAPVAPEEDDPAVPEEATTEPTSAPPSAATPTTTPTTSVTDSGEHLAIGSVPTWGAPAADEAGSGDDSTIPPPALEVPTVEADHGEPEHVGELGEPGDLPADTEPPLTGGEGEGVPLGAVPPPADTQLPAQTQLPTDTELPAQTEAPAETELPAHTESAFSEEDSEEGSGAHRAPARRRSERPTGAPQADLTLDRDAAALVGAAADSPLVLAVLCPAGHPSAAHASRCRVCDREIPGQQPFQTPRPTLGVLTMSTGDVVPVDRGILLGRAPRVNTDVPPAARPHVVRLPSPQKDISRNHVEIVLEGWHVLVKDLGSTNGTTITLPGEAPLRLRPGDPVGIEIGTVINVADEVSISFEAVR